VSPWSPSLLTFTALISMLRFVYDKKDAPFTDLLPPVDAHAAADPPHNCAICVRREEEEMHARGCIIRKAGIVVHGATFHVGDFALVRAEQGPPARCTACWRVFR
jgi:hypothetical protein